MNKSGKWVRLMGLVGCTRQFNNEGKKNRENVGPTKQKVNSEIGKFTTPPHQNSPTKYLDLLR